MFIHLRTSIEFILKHNPSDHKNLPTRSAYSIRELKNSFVGKAIISVSPSLLIR